MVTLVTPHLLITDDDDALRQSLGEAMQRHGFQVMLAADGQEALEVVQSMEIHLALVDVHMPRISGLQLIERLRYSDVQLPCILMSAALDETIRHEAELMHVFRVIGKPFRLAEISQTVRQGLAEHYGWAG